MKTLDERVKKIEEEVIPQLRGVLLFITSSFRLKDKLRYLQDIEHHENRCMEVQYAQREGDFYFSYQLRCSKSVSSLALRVDLPALIDFSSDHALYTIGIDKQADIISE